MMSADLRVKVGAPRGPGMGPHWRESTNKVVGGSDNEVSEHARLSLEAVTLLWGIPEHLWSGLLAL